MREKKILIKHASGGEEITLSRLEDGRYEILALLRDMEEAINISVELVARIKEKSSE
ncbi:MAG: hypothetical protein ACE5KK_06355 [Candidatus Brocadiales bacterium]